MGRSMKKLPRKMRAVLEEIVSAETFDSEEAMDLDGKICAAIESVDIDYDTLKGASPEQLWFYLVWWTEGEVNNGGFEQFFSNKGLPMVREAAKANAAMGLHDVAKLVKRAIAALERVGKPSSVQETCELLCGDTEALHGLNDALGKLDDAFYELDPDPPFIERRLRFVAANPGEFFAE